MLAISRVSKRLHTATRLSCVYPSRSIAATKLYWSTPRSGWHQYGRMSFGSSAVRWDEAVETAIIPSNVPPESPKPYDFAKTLPVVCPGCGAMSQTIEPETPGYFSPRKRNVRKAKEEEQKKREESVYSQAMARLSEIEDAKEEGETIAQLEPEPSEQKTMICDRCHDLLHQSKGNSILHPSMQSIQSIIESSPHKQNHIYHIIDAADFPLSLIPNLISALKLPRLRTQNRRSKSRTHIGGRVADVSFIITRSDLLAPQKEQVDRMMPYLQEVLRDALGRSGKNLRLGNVRCVSAKRGWWTPQVKQEIWKRGGAGWVVGKVNVGKSALFEVVFPKGRDHVAEEEKLRAGRLWDPANSQRYEEEEKNNDVVEEEPQVHETHNQVLPKVKDPVLEDMNSALETSTAENTVTGATSSDGNPKIDMENPQVQNAAPEEQVTEKDERVLEDEDDLGDDDAISLLPPAQPEVQYPQMPIVSALPGTTASPIRIPFGNGKGELIDLPGVMRSSLETHVEPEHRQSLVMKSRVVPEQYTLKPGQSLLLGGVVRITPKTDDLIFLAYPFTPLKAHATGTSKAIAIQTGVQEDGEPYTGTIENIATEKAKSRIKNAGTFRLEWDVTKKRAGPVTDKTAGKRKAENLPYIVYGADILIEGVGWVEIVCQVRRKRASSTTDGLSAEVNQYDPSFADQRPEVEVFTPKGKFIGVRQPMNAWLTGRPKPVAKHAQRSRPRMTISMHKRREGGKKGGQRPSTVPE